MSKSEVFNITNIDHRFSILAKKSCEFWRKYLDRYENGLPDSDLPYLDNEMSAVGSLASAITRFDAKSFVVQEASIEKIGNSSASGRLDLLAYLSTSTGGHDCLCFEAKRSRKIALIEDLKATFSISEGDDLGVRSLIGKGIRDHAKTTGNRLRLRTGPEDVGRVMLLITNLKMSSNVDADISEAKRHLQEAFNGTVTVRSQNEHPFKLTKKKMARFSTVGFIFVPKCPPGQTESPIALVATMTLL